MKKMMAVLLSVFLLVATASATTDLLLSEGKIDKDVFDKPPGTEVTIEVGGEVFFAVKTGGKDGFWFGHLLEGDEYSVNFTLTKNESFVGSINAPGGPISIKYTREGILVEHHLPVELDGDDVVHLTPTTSSLPRLGSARLLATTTPRIGTATIDVLILYTTELKQKYPGELLNARIEGLIETGNEAFRNSNIPMKFRIVHAEEISLTGDIDNFAALDEMSGERLSNEITALRKKYGADVVTMIRPYKQYMTTAGVALRAADGMGNLFQGYTMPPAYSIVVEGEGIGEWIMVHEIGHNLGCDHEKQFAAGIDQKTGEIVFPGAYPYSYGYGVDGRFSTVMAYGGYPKKLQFSDGGKYGEPDANNAASLSNVRWQAADWLPTRIFENPMYFIHVETNSGWETDLVLVNKGGSRVVGTITGLNDNGEEISSGQVILSSGEKRILNAANFFGDQNALVKSAVFSSPEEHEVVGYTEFRMLRYSVTVPATSTPSTGDIYIPHIASNDMWWTGIVLVNTTVETKSLAIDFSNGETRTLILPPLGHKAFAIKSLFGGISQKNIQSATIRNASGVVGMELFGSKDQLSGVPLKDTGETNIVYPHVAGDSWWTGIVAYNPSTSECSVSLKAYSASGDSLKENSFSISGKGRYIGTAEVLGLPLETAWFELNSSCSLVGFELFGAKNNQQLASYSGGATGTAGIFAKREDEGWTGIALVNTEDDPATITLVAHNSDRTAIAEAKISLDAYAKEVALVESFFDEDIDNATYLTYQSDKKIVGLQISGSADNKRLDALPSM